ncbi:unnamed protein product, partial [Rotaria magnacalcarata]
MLILLYSTSYVIILEFQIEYQQSNNNEKHSFLISAMWFISRCISIDSLNTCFQQQKNKSSYDFCLCRGGSGILAK